MNVKFSLDIDKLKECMKERNMGIRSAAREMGIDHGYLSKVLRGENEAGKKFIDGALATFGLRYEDIVKAKTETASESSILKETYKRIHNSQHGQ